MPFKALSVIDLADSKSKLDRARKHAADLENTLHGDGGLWEVREAFDNKTQEWTYRVLLDRRRLNEAKSIIADAADNRCEIVRHFSAASIASQIQSSAFISSAKRGSRSP